MDIPYNRENIKNKTISQASQQRSNNLKGSTTTGNEINEK